MTSIQSNDIFTFELAKKKFDYIITDSNDIGSKELAYILAEDGKYCSDASILEEGGKSWLIEPLRQLQPLSFAVLEEYASDYMVGFYWYAHPPLPHVPKDNLEHFGFLVVKDRVICINAKAGIYNSNSLPDDISNSWYKHSDGWGISSNAVPVNLVMLPNRLGAWVCFDNYIYGSDKKSEKKLIAELQEKIPNIYVTHINAYDGHASQYTSFRCFLDTATPDSYAVEGDLLFTVKDNTDKKVYLVHDHDFKNIRYLTHPAEAIDAYCAHTLLQKPERFDFMPWSAVL